MILCHFQESYYISMVNNFIYLFVFACCIPSFLVLMNTFACVSHPAVHSRSFMEVVKAAVQQGSTARDSVAIRADQKSYSYLQLISSAFNISKLLCSEDLKTVSTCFHGLWILLS